MKCPPRRMVERDPDLVGTVGVAEDDRKLVADEFAAALAAARPADGWSRLAGCALLLAAVGRGASHPAAFWSRFAGRMIAALPLPNGFTLNGFTVNG